MYKTKPSGVMPFAYEPDDEKWIDENLSKLSSSERTAVAIAYGKVYKEASDLEDVSYRKSSAGRRAANKRLRIFIAKKTALANN